MMKNRGTRIGVILVVIFAWLLAIAVVYLVIIKLRSLPL
jgi:hypothetical protein